MSEYTNAAIGKLDGEVTKFKGDKYSNIMYKDVARVLKSFCKQNDEFAQAVIQSEKTFAGCMEQVSKNITGGISDLEAYKRAVKFYFKGADIHYNMTIDLCGELKDKPIEMTKAVEAVKPAPKKVKASSLSLSLDDLFD